MPGVAQSPKFHQKVVFDPVSVPANSTSVQNVLTGVRKLFAMPGDHVLIDAPNLESGLEIVRVPITTPGTIPVGIKNTTGAAINPASQTFYVTVL